MTTLSKEQISFYGFAYQLLIYLENNKDDITAKFLPQADNDRRSKQRDRSIILADRIRRLESQIAILTEMDEIQREHLLDNLARDKTILGVINSHINDGEIQDRITNYLKDGLARSFEQISGLSSKNANPEHIQSIINARQLWTENDLNEAVRMCREFFNQHTINDHRRMNDRLAALFAGSITVTGFNPLAIAVLVTLTLLFREYKIDRDLHGHLQGENIYNPSSILDALESLMGRRKIPALEDMQKWKDVTTAEQLMELEANPAVQEFLRENPQLKPLFELPGQNITQGKDKGIGDKLFSALG